MESNVNNDGDYLDSFPPGYRFRPFEYELINCYLKKKVKNEPLPPNRFMDVELYKFSPEQLEVMYKKGRENEMFFFTQRERKHQNGNVPNRVTGNSSGFWKANGVDKSVKFNGQIIGYKKTLAFYRGAPKNKPVKTNWIMHEFRIDYAPPSKKNGTDMKLDWVLCKIYHRGSESTRAVQVKEEDHHDDDANSLESVHIDSDNNGLLVVFREHSNPSMEVAKPISIMPPEVQSTAESSQRNLNAYFDNMQLPLQKSCSKIPLQNTPFGTDNGAVNSTQQHANFAQNEAIAPCGVVYSTEYDSEVLESLAKMDEYLFQAFNFRCDRPDCSSMPTQVHSSSDIPYNNYGDAYFETMHQQPLQNGFPEIAQSISNSVDAEPSVADAKPLRVLPSLPQSSLYPF